jgi:RNA polymerase sigma-70 factor (ECF subfamily)
MAAMRPLSQARDGELLALAGAEPEAFGVFYDRFEAEVLAFLYRATRRADLAADLTAEVFAAALRSAPGYRDELGSARAWLLGIARHELADAWRRGRVEDTARRALELEALVLSDAALEQIERLGDGAGPALALLAELPPDQRVAVEGRVLEDRDYEELAASLRCSESVVRQRVSRGLRNLRSRLEQTR